VPAKQTRRGHRERRAPGENAKTADRASQALDLRIAGATYRQIGARLAVSEKTAYLDVQAALATLDAVVKGKAERLRDLEARRLDQLTVALAPGIRAGDAKAVSAAVRIMERRARLYGLDAPVKITGDEHAPMPVRIVHQQLRE
jgi:DNA-binding CsgD family transcriptional regulator